MEQLAAARGRAGRRERLAQLSRIARTAISPARCNAAHLLATHTLHPQLLTEEIVIESPVFEQLGVFPGRAPQRMLAKRDHVRSLAGSVAHAAARRTSI